MRAGLPLNVRKNGAERNFKISRNVTKQTVQHLAGTLA